MYSSVWEEIGDVLHTPMCSYTLTHYLCILIDHVYVLHLLGMLCCIVIISVMHCAYNQRYRHLLISAWRTDCAYNQRYRHLPASA